MGLKLRCRPEKISASSSFWQRPVNNYRRRNRRFFYGFLWRAGRFCCVAIARERKLYRQAILAARVACCEFRHSGRTSSHIGRNRSRYRTSLRSQSVSIRWNRIPAGNICYFSQRKKLTIISQPIPLPQKSNPATEAKLK